MAKGSGDTRASRHENNPYHVNGVRLKYGDLPEAQKRNVIALQKTYSEGMRKRLINKTVTKQADGKTIEVGFNRESCEHLSRDAMLKLSGKYFSKESLYRIDEIFAKASYLPSSHELYKERNDGKKLFFKYTDNDGRGVIFKVAFNPTAGDRKFYTLYSIDDIL